MFQNSLYPMWMLDATTSPATSCANASSNRDTPLIKNETDQRQWWELGSHTIFYHSLLRKWVRRFHHLRIFTRNQLSHVFFQFPSTEPYEKEFKKQHGFKKAMTTCYNTQYNHVTVLLQQEVMSFTVFCRQAPRLVLYHVYVERWCILYTTFFFPSCLKYEKQNVSNEMRHTG